VPRQPVGARDAVPPELRHVQGRMHQPDRARDRGRLALLARHAHDGHGRGLPHDRRRAGDREAVGRQPHRGPPRGARRELPGAVPRHGAEPHRPAHRAAQL
jgi:hypothetical protein